MKHEPIRLHPLRCECHRCAPAPRVDMRRALLSAAIASPPVYALLWGVWTILPN